MENSSNAETQASSASAPVFISYASQDAETANQICRSLERQGISCWIAPRDVKPGAQYADAIVRAINDAKAVVLVMSGSAVGSSHVGREVERAASKRKPIIPFRIDSAALNPELEYFLSNSQWIDAPKLGMAAALARLKEAAGQRGGASALIVEQRNTFGRYRIEWSDVRKIEVGNYGTIIFHGKEKRFALAPPGYWSWKQRPEALALLQRKLTELHVVPYRSNVGDYKVHKNVRVSDAEV